MGEVRYTSTTLHPTHQGGKGAVRYTDIFVTVNTNKKPHSEAEESALYDELQHLIEDVMFTDYEIKKILPMDNPNAIYEVIMSNLALETGQKPRGGRVHAHFILNIVHGTNFVLKRANRQFKEWFDNHFSWYHGTNGCNCLVILLTSSKVKNYIAKTGKAPPHQIIQDFA
jgi:hypothetical protein